MEHSGRSAAQTTQSLGWGRHTPCAVMHAAACDHTGARQPIDTPLIQRDCGTGHTCVTRGERRWPNGGHPWVTGPQHKTGGATRHFHSVLVRITTGSATRRTARRGFQGRGSSWTSCCLRNPDQQCTCVCSDWVPTPSGDPGPPPNQQGIQHHRRRQQQTRQQIQKLRPASCPGAAAVT